MFGRLSVWFPSLRSRLSIKKYPEKSCRLPPDAFPALQWEHTQGRTAPSGPPRPQVRSARFPAAAEGPRSPHRPQRGAAAPARPDGGRRDRRRAPTCARSARRRPGAPSRAPAAGAQRGAAGPRKSCGRHRHRRAVRDGSAGRPPLPARAALFFTNYPSAAPGKIYGPRRDTDCAAPCAGLPLAVPPRSSVPDPIRTHPPALPRPLTALRGGGGGRRGRRGLGRAPRRRERSAAPG